MIGRRFLFGINQPIAGVERKTRRYQDGRADLKASFLARRRQYNIFSCLNRKIEMKRRQVKRQVID